MQKCMGFMPSQTGVRMPDHPFPAPHRYAALLAFARRIYRGLPPQLRRHLLPLARLVLLLFTWRKRSPLPRPAGSGVTVAGLFSSPTGIGEGARLCADALERLGWRVERLDLAPSFGQDLPELRHAPEPPLADGPIILHMNPPLFAHARALLGRHRRKRKLIGYWAWELEKVPGDWSAAATGLDEIWTPSRFCADAVQRAVTVPVRVVPHPVAKTRIAPARTSFGLPEDACVFLSFVNLHSNLARKNPRATLQAYARAFPTRRLDVLLLLKLDGEDVAPKMAAELRSLAASCPCPVRFVTGTLPAERRDQLIASCDGLISLHRSEGFGLTMAEAMALGVPVIATAWSGNLDFTLPGHAGLVRAATVPVEDPQGFYDPTTVWAEPDLDEAASWLQRLAASPALRRAMADASTEISLPALFAAALQHTALAAPALPPTSRPVHRPVLNTKAA
jgi:glycosyltransferase involved in cell wall biosynthesis